MNPLVFKKAKGPKRITTQNQIFYDLSSSRYLFGHSPGKITHRMKNILSTQWMIRGRTVWHLRLLKKLKALYPDFDPVFYHSLEEMLPSQDFRVKSFHGLRMENFFQCLKNNRFSFSSEGGTLHDMTEMALNEEKTATGTHDILNYYWHPVLPESHDKAGALILPAFLNPMSDSLILMIRRDTGNRDIGGGIFDDITSGECALLLNQIALFETQESGNPVSLDHPDILQYGRVFALKTTDDEKNEAFIQEMIRQKLYLSQNKPYYHYLPYPLTEHEFKTIRRKIHEFSMA